MNLRKSIGSKTATIGFGVFVLAIIVGSMLFWASYRQLSSSDIQITKVGSKISDQDTAFLPPPRVAEIFPSEGAENVLVAIEDPIRVRFASSVKPFFIRFDLDPEGEVVYENNPEKTEFKLLPKNPFPDGTHHTLRLSYKLREAPDSTYRQFYETSFETIAYAVSDRSKDIRELLQEAKAYVEVKQAEGKYIDINLKTQTMVLFENGEAMKSYPISSGKPGMATPKGKFSIHNKAPRPWSKAYGLYMPYWMAIVADGKIGIHELPEWPSGYKEGANHLGHPVSHGCVRLGVGPAKEAYNWADIGTVVIVH